MDRTKPIAVRAWFFAAGKLRRRDGGAGINICAGPDSQEAACDVASSSPDGRWIAIDVAGDEGDYIHHSLILADLDTGALAALNQQGELEIGHDVPPCLRENRCVDIVGETPVHWIGGRAMLSIDDRLIDLSAQRVRVLPGVPSP